MNSRRGMVTAIAVVGLVAMSYVGWRAPRPSLLGGPRAIGGHETLGRTAAVLDPSSSAGTGEVKRLIRAYEAQVRTRPTATSLSFLGQLYLADGKMTGDVATYQRALDSLSEARDRFPKDLETQSLLASARYTTHDFTGATAGARQVLAADPRQWAAVAVEGDAALETGDYQRAATDYTALAAALPDVAAVEVRQSRLAYLHGDTKTAAALAAAAERHAHQSGLAGAGLAFYGDYRAQLALDTGDPTLARTAAERALAAAPTWHVALAQLAKVRAAAGDLAGAAGLYERAVAVVPQPDYLAALGDIESARGQTRPAKDHYATVRFIATVARLNQQVYNRQLVLFDADHAVAGDEAVRLAQTELRTRTDVFGWDAYAWALLRAGHVAEAAVADTHALALGTRDPKLLFHAGMIASAAGDSTAARDRLGAALRLSPHFDVLLAPVARAELGRLSR